MRSVILSSIALLSSLSGAAVAAPHLAGCTHGADHTHAPGIELAHACWPGEGGTLTGTLIEIEHDVDQMVEIRRQLDLDLRGGVDPRQYIDIVFVGDGYTASEQGQYLTDATNIANQMFRDEPFITYEPYFRIHMVEVISNESGVDNDPVQGIERDTALNMGFWCGGTERALCVSVNRALNAARDGVETDVDQVLAIANTTKYGGVGYPSSNLGTSSGRNGSATEIVIHELGHSLGNLADEYTYGGSETYTGGEFGTANVSIYNQAEQIAQQRKWYRWMGENAAGFDGPVGAYEGGNYSTFGVYRPTNNSMMRSLGRPFSLINAEGLIKEFYREVRPIQDATPVDSELDQTSSLYVLPAQPNGHDLDITWFLNGSEIPGTAGQANLDLASVSIPAVGESELSVVVVDPTPWVRDPAIRDQFLTDTRTWIINECDRIADLDQNGVFNFLDLSLFLLGFNAQDPMVDFDNSGTFNFLDLSIFLNEFNEPCGSV